MGPSLLVASNKSRRAAQDGAGPHLHVSEEAHPALMQLARLLGKLAARGALLSPKDPAAPDGTPDPA